jgi:hypothetical protein
MPGISNRIVSFANFYNQLKIQVVVVSPFVKLSRVTPSSGRISPELWSDKMG